MPCSNELTKLKEEDLEGVKDYKRSSEEEVKHSYATGPITLLVKICSEYSML